jgi:hypothetical protein
MMIFGKAVCLRRARKMVAVSLLLLVLAFCTYVFLGNRDPIVVSLQGYERHETTNYAVLLLRNISKRQIVFNEFNTEPKATVRHFVSLKEGGKWTDASELKPSKKGIVSFATFVLTINPDETHKTRVPVDSALRRIAIPIERSAEDRTEHENFFLRLRFKLRQFLGLKEPPITLVWCPDDLIAE